MNCCVCKTADLQPTTLETNLPARTCPTCQGIWLSSEEYLHWLAQHGNLPEKPPAGDAPPPQDVPQAKICPECGHILRRYKIGHDLTFHLDRCNHCNGVWLDKNEWDVLKSHNLHDDLNLMFTNVWQMQVQQEEKQQFFEAMYTQKYGTADYAEIRRIREWLYNHPRGMELLAFLTDKAPYR